MAANLDMVIEQGATFEHRLIWKDSTGTEIDLTGYSARMHMRAKIADVDFIMELTDGNGRITLGGALGTIDIEISAEDTATLTTKNMVYDLEMVIGVAPEHVTRLVEGKVTLSKEVTR